MLAMNKKGEEFWMNRKKTQYFDKQSYVGKELMLSIYETEGVNVKFLNSFIRSMDDHNVLQLTVKEISDKAGVSINTGKASMKSLVNGMFVRRFHERMYQLSPAVFFRTNGQAREVAYAMYISNDPEVKSAINKIKRDRR